jgi:hypothetical protein
MRIHSLVGLLAALVALPADGADYLADVQPVLAKACYNCHGPKQQMAGLRLDMQSAALAKVIQPGRGGESTLYRRIAGLDDLPRMPMGGTLAPAQIEAIKTWIDEGAVWPEAGPASASEASKHWAFIPPKRPAGPASIDGLIRARLVKEGLQPSPAADRVTLLRRASLDVVGLPPTPEEIDAFVRDRKPGAWARQVDRLLASPHYGERWARVWLDAARYADSDGHEKDKQRQVWFYRD